ncbi:MAG: SAM-dependent methyltransferase [Micavibrio sp.]|nr:SAM-dependent methyltransferase [Micavibrio sp.]
MAPSSDIFIFDRKKIRAQRNRALKNIKENNFLIKWTTNQLLSRLEIIKKEFPCALQVGTRADIDQRQINGLETLITMDGTDGKNSVVADEEFLPFASESFDLIISALNLHTTNDLPGTLLQLRRSLKPDGLFMCALLGGETLYEMRDIFTQAEMEVSGGISPRVAPFADMPQMGSLMQRAGFNLPVVDSEIITVTYDNLFKLIHDLRMMGEGNALIERSKSFNNRTLLMRAADLYQEKYSEPDGKIAATFEIIFLVGWSPHESQQKPLRPGSAKARLSDALNTEEISTKEKATP